jgi:hypothetical protein
MIFFGLELGPMASNGELGYTGQHREAGVIRRLLTESSGFGKEYVMLWRVTTVITVGLILLTVDAARAQKADKKVQLLAGGRTVAGPGGFTGAPGDHPILLFTNEQPLCVTVVNTGKVNVLGVVKDAAQVTNANEAAPGQATSACRDNATQVEADCRPGSGPCKFLWRIDSQQ